MITLGSNVPLFPKDGSGIPELQGPVLYMCNPKVEKLI